MSELRLEDIGAIVGGLLLVGVGLFSVMALIALWPKISAIAGAIWHRYVVFSWDDLMAWLADLDNGSVNTFEDDEAPPMPSNVMTSAAQRPDHTGMILVYTTNDLIDAAARLTERERIAVLSAMRDDQKRLYSANKIAAFLGGDRNSVLATVREFRPAAEDDDTPYTTPIAGRPTRAQFETDPELAYQQPPQ